MYSWISSSFFFSRSINHSSDFSSHETHVGNLGGSNNANLGVNFEFTFVAKKIVATFFGFVIESGIFFHHFEASQQLRESWRAPIAIGLFLLDGPEGDSNAPRPEDGLGDVWCNRGLEPFNLVEPAWWWLLLHCCKATSDSLIDAMFYIKRNLQDWGTPSSFLQFVVSHAYSAGGSVRWRLMESWKLGVWACRCLWLGWMSFRNGLKKTSLKRCLSKSSNFWLLMAVSFPGWFLQCAHGPRLCFPLCSRGGEAAAQLTRGQWCFVKDSPRFTHHQYTIHGRQSDGVLCCRLASCSMMVCCPGPCEDWMASQSRETQFLGKSWWMWWGIFVYLLSWNTVMLHEFFSFSWVTVEWEL